MGNVFGVTMREEPFEVVMIYKMYINTDHWLQDDERCIMQSLGTKDWEINSFMVRISA